MASSNYQLFYFLNGNKINDSKRIELLLKTVGISSDLGTTVLTISESSGKFAFGNKVLGGIANGTASGEALSYSQLGANNGVASLDAGGKIPVNQLPISIDRLFTPTNKEAVDALVERDFVKMLVAGQVTKLLSTDSVGEESFFGCVKVGGAKDATVDVYIPEVGARVTGFSGLDVTKLLYASAVDGGGYTQLRPTAGKVIILGKAVSATEIIFMGRFDSEYDAAVEMLVEGGGPGTTSFSETVGGGSPSSTSFETTLDGGTP